MNKEGNKIMKRKSLLFISTIAALSLGGIATRGLFVSKSNQVAQAAYAATETNVSYIEKSWDDVNQEVVSTPKTHDCAVVESTDAYTSWKDGEWYVVNSDVTIDTSLWVYGTPNLILADGFTLTVKNGFVLWGKSANINIYAQSEGNNAGTLISYSLKDEYNHESAAIGGFMDEKAGNIVIHGGNINATSSGSGAAIGGGPEGDGCNVTIFGGTVTANGGNSAAGIGGGTTGDGGNVTIYGGTVDAKGGSYGAGIGGGDGGSGGQINIFGGTVTANGGYCGAGIGGGCNGSGGKINIFGGTVTANGGDDSAGIGGSREGDGGYIAILGGTVTAKGGDDAAGIGGGSEGDGGNITISGGTVTAKGGRYGAGIGSGMSGNGGNVTISGGTVTANGGDDASGIGGGHWAENEGTLSVTGPTLVLLGNDANEPSYPDDVFKDTTKRYRYMAVIKLPHTHNWSYSADGATITASCSNPDCPVTEGLTLELEAPASLTYSGNAKAATFKAGYSEEAFSNPTIKYYQGTSEVASCVNAGTYTAKVTFGTATAELEFTIAKADLDPAPAAVTDRNAVYGESLSDIELPDGWTWNNPSDKVGNAGTNQHKATFTPEDADNYNTVEQDVNVIVAKANPEYTVPTDLTTLVNKTLSTITLPAGWTWDDPTQNVGSELGNKVFKGTFTPEDTDNYNLVEHVDITVQVIEHEHNWSYTASGATITAFCSNPDCPVTEGLILELQAPTGDMHYDGNAKAATLKVGYSLEAFPNATIKYFNNNKEVNECVNVGKYTAKVTFGNAVAFVEFEILGKTIVDPTQSAASVEIDNVVVPENITLKVQVRTDVAEKDIAEDYAKIQAKLEPNEQISKVYDVKLIQTTGGIEKEIQPSDIKEGLKITVRMAIPEGIDMNNVRILHIHNVDDMEFVSNYKVEGNDIVFEIDRLSQFAFVTNVNAPAAGLNGGIIALIIILSILALLGICFCLLFFVFAKFIIIKDKEGKEKVVRAIKIGKDNKDNKNYLSMFVFNFKKELRVEEEVFNKKKDAEEFLKNKVQ